MNRYTAIALLALPFLLFSCSSSERGPGTAIEITAKPGEEYRMITLTSQVMQSGLKDRIIEHKQNIETHGFLRVLGVSPGGLELQVNYTRVRCLLQGHQGNVLFDSEENKKVPAPAQEYAQLVGTSFKAVVSPRGEVTRLSGGGALDSGNEDSLKSLFQNTFAFYPTSSVHAGDKWKKNTEIKALGFKIQSEWTYNSTQEGYHSISAKGVIESSRKSAEKSFLDLHGTQKGEILVRSKTGLPELIKVNRTMSGFSINPNKGSKTPMAIETETKFELHPLATQSKLESANESGQD